MKPNRLVLGLALAIGLAGCTKKEELPECMGSCTVITGRLLTSESAPLPKTPIVLEWHGNFSGLHGEARRKAAGSTDADGYYRLSAFLADDELKSGYLSVVFQADKAKYFLIGEPHYAFFDFKRDTLLSVPNYLIPRKAFLKIVVTNPSQVPSPFAYYIDLSSCYGGNTVFSQNLNGGGSVINCSGIPETTLEVAGDQPILVRQRKNGAYISSNDTLFIPAGTTKTYTVTY